MPVRLQSVSCVLLISVGLVSTEGLAQPEPAPKPAEPTPPDAAPAPVAAPIAEQPVAHTVAPSIAPVAPPQPAADPIAKEEKKPEAFPAKLTVGKEGYFQPGLLLQAWFQYDRTTDHPDPKKKNASAFRVRRAEIHAKGDILPGTIGYGVMIDPAKVLDSNFKDATVPVANQDPAPTDPKKPETVTVKQPSGAISMLQDVFVTFKSEYVDTSIGQFKIPVSWEGYNSSSKLLFPERSLVSREYGDKRDLGLRLAKTFKYVGYSAGLFNGAGQNTAENNTQKDLGLRLEVYPVDGLVLAGVLYAGVGHRTDPGTKDRYEGDVRYENGPFLLQGEFIGAKEVSAANTDVKGQGFYGALGWTFIDALQPAVRVGFLDPDTSKDLDPATDKGKDEVLSVEGTVNYYFQKNEAKVQLAYSRFLWNDAPKVHEVTLAGQVGF